MSHSFLCLPGHRVYPVFGYRQYLCGGGDFSLFLTQPAASQYLALSFVAST